MADLTLRSYKERLIKAVKQLNRERDAAVTLIALDALAVVKSRVINTGITAEGGTFSPYSEDYEKIRQDRGFDRLTKNKNFTFTAQMWANIQPQIVGSSRTSTIIQYGSPDQFSQDKLEWNSTREGRSIVDLSVEELALISSLNSARILGVFAENGIGKPL